jgi:hypothetical protein
MSYKICRTNRAIIAAALFLLSAGRLLATIITVTSGADSGAGTLRQAISDAAPGDTINFAPSLTAVTLTSAELLIDKSLAINGPGANLLAVQRATTIGTPEFRIFDISPNTLSNVTISGLTIANGIYRAVIAFSFSGGGISATSVVLTITGCTISGNQGIRGGGIFANGNVTVNLINSTLSENSADDAGGAILTIGTLNVTNSTISNNSAAGRGGGIALFNQTMSVTNSTISGNSAGLAGTNPGGGGIWSGEASTSATIKNSIIARNTSTSTAPDFSGGFTSQGYNLIGNTSGTTITGTTTGNQLNVDPVLGPLQDNGGPTFTQALLSGSTAIEAGNSSGSNTDQRGFVRPVDDPGIANASGGDGSDIGAFEVQANQLPGCKNINAVVSNANDSGAASLRDVIGNVCAGTTITFAPNVRGAINLTSGELALNKGLQINGPGANLLSVQRSAAAGNFRIFHITGNYSVAISGLTIANGNVTGTGNLGGGIYNPGTLTLTNATVSGNTALNGGGIHNDFGTLSIISSTLSGNTVSSNTLAGSGGGIFNRGGTVALSNSTISGNTAIGPGGNDSGGGIITNVGTVSLTNSTIAGNSADLGGGIRNINGGTVNSFNTIVALNTITAPNTSANGPDVNGPLTSQGFNLIGNASGATISPAQFSDQIGVSAAQLNLGPLQDNGGTTFTHALLSGSFAIDQGNVSASVMDQRGFARPVDLAVPNATGGDGGDIGAFEFGSTPLLRITSITHLANGHILLQCNGVPNKLNNLQTSSDLSPGSFVAISPAPPAADASGSFQYDDAGTFGLTKRFYRLTLP